MELWILSEDFERLGIVDTATSIIWAGRFRQCGDFEIYVSYSDYYRDLLKEDRLVVREDDDMVGIIENVQDGTDTENGDFLIVSGRCARSILSRRIVWDQTTLDCTVEEGMRQLVTDAFISPEIPERKYEKLTLAAPHGYTDEISAQYTGDNILDVLESLSASNNYGFDITLRDSVLVLDFRKGVDRSRGQHTLPRVVFSEEYDNLQTATYILNKADYKTVALVAGEGEGEARRRTIVGRNVDQSGLHRREVYVDARDVSSNDGKISASEYEAQLAERGDTALAEAPMVQSMEGTIEPMQMYTYKQDYFLGDIVTVINKHGVEVNTQVLEVVEVWDENGYTCTPTFG